MADPQNPQDPQNSQPPVIPPGYDAVLDISKPYPNNQYAVYGDITPGALLFNPLTKKGGIITQVVTDNKGTMVYRVPLPENPQEEQSWQYKEARESYLRQAGRDIAPQPSDPSIQQPAPRPFRIPVDSSGLTGLTGPMPPATSHFLPPSAPQIAPLPGLQSSVPTTNNSATNAQQSFDTGVGAPAPNDPYANRSYGTGSLAVPSSTFLQRAYNAARGGESPLDFLNTEFAPSGSATLGAYIKQKIEDTLGGAIDPVMAIIDEHTGDPQEAVRLLSPRNAPTMANPTGMPGGVGYDPTKNVVYAPYAYGRGIGEGVAPAAGGMAGAAYGAKTLSGLVAMVPGLGENPYAQGGALLVGGVAGAFGGGHLAAEGQQALMNYMLTPEVRQALQAQNAAIQTQQPGAYGLGQITAQGLVARPNLSAGRDAMIARATGGALAGGMDAVAQARSGQPFDYWRNFRQTTSGIVFSGENTEFGEIPHSIGEAAVIPSLRRASDNAAEKIAANAANVAVKAAATDTAPEGTKSEAAGTSETPESKPSLVPVFKTGQTYYDVVGHPMTIVAQGRYDDGSPYIRVSGSRDGETTDYEPQAFADFATSTPPAANQRSQPNMGGEPSRVPTPEVSLFRAGANAIDQAQGNWQQALLSLSPPGFPSLLSVQAAPFGERPFSLGTSSYSGGSTGFRYQGMLPDGRVRIAHPSGLHFDLSLGRAAELASGYLEAPSVIPGQTFGQKHVPYTDQVGASASDQPNSAPTKVRPPADPNSYGEPIRQKLLEQAKQYEQVHTAARKAADDAHKEFKTKQNILAEQYSRGIISYEAMERRVEELDEKQKAARAHLEAVEASWIPLLQDVLGAPDPVGVINVESQLKNRTDPRIETTRQAASFVGSLASRSLFPMTLRDMILAEETDPKRIEEGRASHNAATGTAFIFDNTPLYKVVHEFGHHIESSSPTIIAARKAFYQRRTAGEPLVPIGGDHRPDEMTREDAFLDPYMGKDYDHVGRPDSSEILSMGLEYLFKNPTRLAKEDPDFFNFLIATLHNQPTVPPPSVPPITP